MKKTLRLLAIFIVMCFCACKKDADSIDTSTYYIKADFNGTEQKFSDNATAGEYSGDITAGFAMSAKNNINNKAIDLVIQHVFGITVTNGVYESNSGNHSFSPAGSYVIADSIFFGSGVVPNSSAIKITISNLTSSVVSGTFSGVFNNRDDTNDNIVITSGKFYLPVH